MDKKQLNFSGKDSYETADGNEESPMNQYRREEMYPYKENKNSRIVEHLMNSFEEKASVVNETNGSIRKENSFVEIDKTHETNGLKNKRNRNSASSGRDSTKDGTSEGSVLLDRYNHSIKENVPMKNSFQESKNQMNFKCDTISTLCPSTSFETAACSDSIRNVNNPETKIIEQVLESLDNAQINRVTECMIKEEYVNQRFDKEYMMNFYNMNHRIKQEENYNPIDENSLSVNPTSENLSTQEKHTEEMLKQDGKNNEEWTNTKKKKELGRVMIQVDYTKKENKNIKMKAKKKRKGRIYKVKVRGKTCWRAEWYVESKDISKESGELDDNGNIIQKEKCENEDIEPKKKELKNPAEELNRSKTKSHIHYIKKSKQFSESVYGYHNARFFSLFELIKHRSVPYSLIEEANQCIRDLKKNISDNKQGKTKERYFYIMKYLASSSKNMDDTERKTCSEVKDPLSPKDKNKNLSSIYEEYPQEKSKHVLHNSFNNNMHTNYNEGLLEKEKKTPTYFPTNNVSDINHMHANYLGNYLYVKDTDRSNLMNYNQSYSNHLFETSTNGSEKLIKDIYSSYIQNPFYNKENTFLQKQENSIVGGESSQEGLGKQEVSFDPNYQNANQEDSINYIKNDTNLNNMIYKNCAFPDNNNNNNNNNVPSTTQTPNMNSSGTSKYFGNDWGNLNDLKNFHFMYNQSNDNTMLNNINSVNYLNYANPLNMLDINFQKSFNNNSIHHRVNTCFPFNSVESMEKPNNPVQPMIYNHPYNNQYRNMYVQEAATPAGEYLANQSYVPNDKEDYYNYNNLNQSLLSFENIPKQNEMIPMNKRVNNNGHFTNELIHKNNISFNKNSLDQTILREETKQDSSTYPYFM